MKKYELILFDADETLFDFDAYRGLSLMFSRYNVKFTLEDYHAYEITNQPLWAHYQNGLITSLQLQHLRFAVWAEKLQIPATQLNSSFMCAMAEICVPLEGALSLLNTLKNKTQLGIITNGFIELQQNRLLRTGLIDHFNFVVISEALGIAKPHRGIFDHALAMVGNPDRDKVLMVGDNPDSDILGGINAGIDTCWVNANNRPNPNKIVPTYQISALPELETLLASHFKKE